MNLLLTGSTGQLGKALTAALQAYPEYQLLPLPHHSYDLEKPEKLYEQLLRLPLDTEQETLLINSAAYTAVDAAESAPLRAQTINATAVEAMAKVCAERGFRMIQISTDYVFDGNASQPYTVGDTPNPQSVYGKTKLQGEQAVRDHIARGNYAIVRTAWLYSHEGKNFFTTILRLASERDTLRVVNDQIGSPTYAADLAEGLLLLLQKKEWQEDTLHVTNRGATSWYHFAQAIVAHSPYKCQVLPIPSCAYPTPARRPAYSVLAPSPDFVELTLPPWQEALDRCYRQYQGL